MPDMGIIVDYFRNMLTSNARCEEQDQMIGEIPKYLQRILTDDEDDYKLPSEIPVGKS